MLHAALEYKPHDRVWIPIEEWYKHGGTTAVLFSSRRVPSAADGAIEVHLEIHSVDYDTTDHTLIRTSCLNTSS